MRDGGIQNSVYIFEGVKDGYDRITFGYAPVYSSSEPEKTITADSLVMDNAQNVLLPDDVRITVLDYDSGEPIDEKAAENLFEPFVTGDESRTSKGGTGLGLSIAHKIAILHGFDLKLLQGWSVPADVRLEGFTKCFEISSDNKNI